MLDVLDHDYDKDVETWIKKIQQQRATDFFDQVHRRIMRARRIIEFLNSWNHPSINDVPRGALDSTHKMQVEAWVQDNARARRDYATRVTAAIYDMREVLEDEKKDHCLDLGTDIWPWRDALKTLESKKDGYCSKVDKSLKSANRMMDFFYLRTPPSTDLPMGWLDESTRPYWNRGLETRMVIVKSTVPT